MAFRASRSRAFLAYLAYLAFRAVQAFRDGHKDSDVPTFRRERPVVPAFPVDLAFPVDPAFLVDLASDRVVLAFPDVPAFRAGRASVPAGLPCGDRLRELPESGPASAQVVMIDGADQAADRADSGPVPVAQVVPAGQAVAPVALVGVASVPVAPAD